MTGFVYAIGDDAGLVKIGWSTDPVRRLSHLRTGSARGLRLLGLVEATVAQEKEAHDLLHPWRARGEWFRLEGAVAAFVAMLRKPNVRIVAPEIENHPLRIWRQRNGVTQDALGAMLNVEGITVYRWEQRKRVPQRKYWFKIKQITSVEPAVFFQTGAAA